MSKIKIPQLEKAPPKLDPKDIPGSIKKIDEYFIYMREQYNHIVDLINKNWEGV